MILSGRTTTSVLEESYMEKQVPVRRPLPDDRQALTHKFNIVGYEGYVTVGLYEDGNPGELFIVMAKLNSTVSGFADAFARAVTIALQYGVPLEVIVQEFVGDRFEPSGPVLGGAAEIRFAKSVVDYVARWMGLRFPMAVRAPRSTEDDELSLKR